jgi:hydroxymethylpyrimidine/phosphomethylpyrimidine kinase
LEVLDELIQFIHKKYPEVKIIWDPILKASAGFQFHESVEENLLHEILTKIFLITPNVNEAKAMMHEEDAFIAAKTMGRFCNVFLKSMNDYQNQHVDVLFEKGKEHFFKTEFLNGAFKHGSGCVLSSSIVANLAKGFDLKAACEEAKAYTLEFLKSSEGLLGIHHNIKLPQHA